MSPRPCCSSQPALASGETYVIAAVTARSSPASVHYCPEPRQISGGPGSDRRALFDPWPAYPVPVARQVVLPDDYRAPGCEAGPAPPAEVAVADLGVQRLQLVERELRRERR